MKAIVDTAGDQDMRQIIHRQHRLALGDEKIVVVHRQKVVADALAASLSACHGFKVLAQGHNAVEAIALARSHQPQVMLLDESIDDAPSKVVLASIALHSFRTSIVLLRATVEAPSRWESPVVAGEHLQRDDLESLVGLVRLVIAGRRSSGPTRVREWPASQLVSNRERSVLSLVALGKTNTQIAHELYISTSTVKRHLSNTYAKLEAHSRVEAVRQAQRLGVIELD